MYHEHIELGSTGRSLGFAFASSLPAEGSNPSAMFDVEEITADIPNVGETALAKLDEAGIAFIGAEVNAGDILVGKVTPKGETELTPEGRLLRAIFGEKAREVRDTSLKVPHGESGTVIEVRTFNREDGDELPPRLLGGGLVRSVRGATGQWFKGRPIPGYYSAFMEFEDGTPATLIYSGYGFFDTAELFDWVGEGGQYRAPETNLNVRKKLREVRTTEEEEQLKEGMRFGGQREGEYSHVWSGERKQPFFDGAAKRGVDQCQIDIAFV